MKTVRDILTLPSIFKHIGDDFTPQRLEFQPVDHPAVWYVLAYDGEELLGCFMFAPENAVCWQVHTCLLPSAMKIKGRFAECGRAVINWVWDNTQCLRIVTYVPEFNRLALAFARRVGLIEYGMNPMSYLKGGRLWGQICLGISKMEGYKCL